MPTNTIPEIPVDWVDYGDFIISPGCHPLCAVLHRASPSSYHGLVVHTAYVNENGGWSYEGGTYFHVDELEKARQFLFHHRNYVR
jgi:hypothetical protein